MERYADVGESGDFDRFPSPFDSGISRKVLEIARKYGVSLSGGPNPRSFSPTNTQNLIKAMRKKYLPPPFPSVDTPDWQVSDSEPGSPAHLDEEVQTEKLGRDEYAQTEGTKGGNRQEREETRSRQWDIKRVPTEKLESLGGELTGKPPLSPPPAVSYEKKTISRLISRSKLRNFEAFLQEHPIILPTVPATSLLDTDPTLLQLADKKRSLQRNLQRLEAAKAEL